MSSSRPSRRLSSPSVVPTINYNSNPRWRSPYTKDARAKTTLSLVFAEPEEPKSASPGTAEKHIASMHDALNSQYTLLCVFVARFLIYTSVELPADTVSEQVIPETRKGSWFGSISRKRKRTDTTKPVLETLTTGDPADIILEVEPTPPLQTANPVANDEHQPTPAPGGGGPVEPPKQTSPDNVPPPSWSPTPPPRAVPQNVQGVLSKPTHLDILSPTISISSIDDIVPQPKPLPTLSIPVPPQNPIPVGVGGVGDVTTAAVTGTTTSRFTLRIPLLGRPKMPLDQAVAVAQAEDVRNPVPATPINGGPPTPLDTPTTEEVQRPSILAIPSNTSTWQINPPFHTLIPAFRQMYSQNK